MNAINRTYITRNKHATTNLDCFQKQADFQGVSVGSQLGYTTSNRASGNRRNFLQDRYDVAADGVSINSIGFKAWF